MRHRRFLILGALVAAVGLLPATASAKHHHRDGVSQCQQRLADKIATDHLPSRGSSFDSDVQRSADGRNAVTISGRGRVRTANGKKRRLTYSCVYNLRSGKLSKVRYNIR